MVTRISNKHSEIKEELFLPVMYGMILHWRELFKHTTV